MHINTTSIFLVLISLGLVATVIVSILTEYTPQNDMATKYDTSGISFIINKESTLLIPLKNVFIPKTSDLTLTIYPIVPFKKIVSVKLYTTSDSILSYYGDFKLTDTVEGGYIYKMKVYAQHDLEVENTTNTYKVATYYINNSGQLKQAVIPFTWPIKTLDFSDFTYFWIVLIGVIVSRLVTRYVEDTRKEPEKDGNKVSSRIEFEGRDYLWIAFSGIITLLIFTEFQKNVQPTTNIITNISLAFGFGFGFDRILDVGQKFQVKKA